MSRDKNRLLVQKASELNEEDEDKAIQIYKSVIEMDAAWSVPYYNLGLIYKYKNEWQSSYEFLLKATKLEATDEAAWWNFGIACTALKKWREARIAWNKFGLELEVNDDEVNMELGPAPIRLFNDEVVWTTRICPARAYIESVSLQKNGYEYNDLLLIDGSPIGKEVLDGIEYSVFDELETLEASGFSTYSIGVEVNDFDDIMALEEDCYNLNFGFENWTILCRQCVEDVPHEEHDEDLKNEMEEYNLAIATPSLEALEKILGEWTQKSGSAIIWIE